MKNPAEIAIPQAIKPPSSGAHAAHNIHIYQANALRAKAVNCRAAHSFERMEALISQIGQHIDGAGLALADKNLSGMSYEAWKDCHAKLLPVT